MPNYLVELEDGRKLNVESDIEPTDDDINDFLNQGAPPSPAPASAPSETFLGQSAQKLATGTRQALAGAKTTLSAATGFNETAGRGLSELAAAGRQSQDERTPQDIAFANEMAQNAKEFDAASGVMGKAGEFIDYAGIAARNPRAAFQMGLQSVPNALISIPAAALGKAAGAAAGLAAGIESGPGAVATGAAGMAAGSISANILMEGGGAIADKISTATNGASANWTPEQFTAFLDANPDIVKAGLKSGVVRGGVIGTVDALSMGLAGRVMKPAMGAASRAGMAARGAAATGIEMGSQGAGEALAGYVDTGKVDSEAVAQEILGGVGTGVPSALVGRSLSAIRPGAAAATLAPVADPLAAAAASFTEPQPTATQPTAAASTATPPPVETRSWNVELSDGRKFIVDSDIEPTVEDIETFLASPDAEAIGPAPAITEESSVVQPPASVNEAIPTVPQSGAATVYEGIAGSTPASGAFSNLDEDLATALAEDLATTWPDLTTSPATEGDLTQDFPMRQVTMAPRFRDPNELAPVEVGAGNAFVGLPRTEAAQAEARLYDEKMARFRSAKTAAEPKQPVIPDAPYGGYDILDFVNDNVIQLLPKAERTTGEYDWAETIDLEPKYNRYLFHSKRGSAIDKVAQRAFEENLISDPTPDALMSAIESTARQRDSYQAEQDAQEKRLQEMEAAAGGKLESPTAIAWADSVIAGSMETPFIGIDPRLMVAYTIKGAEILRNGITTFTQWSAEMIQRFGKKVREYLQDVWRAAMKNSQRGSVGGDPLQSAPEGISERLAKWAREDVDAETAAITFSHPTLGETHTVADIAADFSQISPSDAVKYVKWLQRLDGVSNEMADVIADIAWIARIPSPSTQSGFRKLNNSGTTAGFLNADILAESLDLIRQGVTNFADWSRAMVTRFGQRIRDYLQDVWRLSEGGFAGTGGSPLNSNTPSAENIDWEAPRTDPVLLTNAAEAERLTSEGKQPGPTGNQGTREQVQRIAKEMFDLGGAPATVADIIAQGRTHSAVEYALMEIYAGALDRQIDEASAVLADPLSDPKARALATQQIIAGDIERDRVEIAARVSGSKLGAALGSRRWSMAREEIPNLNKMVADLVMIQDPTGKTPLAPEDRRKVEAIHADMVKAKEARDEQRETGPGGAEDTYRLELQKLLKEAQEQLAAEQAENKRTRAALEEAMKPGSKIVRVSKAVGERIKSSADEARARMAARGIQFSANPMFDLAFIADAAIIMADNIRRGLDFSIELIKQFGDDIRPFLNQIRDKADIYIAEEKKRKTPQGIKDKAAQNLKDGKAPPADLARQLALAHITQMMAAKDPTMSAPKVAELVRADLEEIQPGITTRETRDLISGYGKSTKPAADAAQQTLRDYKAQMRKLTQIEALRKGEPLLKTGPQRDAPSAEQRDLTRLLEDLKRETGYQSRSREDELRSIRDRIKTTLENQIEDLRAALAGKARPTAPRERAAYDAELQALQTQRNALQALVEEMPAHRLANEARRNRTALAAAEASEKEFRRRAAAKEWNRPGKVQGPNTEAVQNARDLAAAARKDYLDLKAAANPKADPEAKQLAAFKRRLQKQITTLEDRISQGDFEPKKKTPRQIQHDEQSAALNLKLAETKRKFIDLKIAARMANMGLAGRTFEAFRTGLFTIRSIMAGGEFSAIGRQGILKALSHPIRFIGDLKAMTRAFQSKIGEQQMLDEIWARPNAVSGIYKQAGLAIHNPDDYSELLAEGAARSALSDKIPWFSHTARAYTGLLNHMRADMFDMLVKKRSRDGQEELSKETLTRLADFVNDATGSGKLGFGKHVLRGTARDVASTLMFSPSFFMSRLRFLTGASLMGADKRTAAIIGTEYARMAAGYMTLFALLNALRDAGEDELEKDVTSGAFLKMDFGKTSVDLMAGLSQMATFWSRLIASAATNVGLIDAPTKRQPEIAGTIWRFARSKESPQAGVVLDIVSGKDSMGQPVDFRKPESWMRTGSEMITPMVFNSIRDIAKAEPNPRAAALSAAAMVGIGTNVRNRP
jgi:hypothetical protein